MDLKGRPRRREPLRARPADATEVVDVRGPEMIDLREQPERQRVLVVDDEPGIRDWLRIDLRERGWAVNTARDLEEGYEMANRLRPQVVILDQRLPDGKGIDCARVLRERHPEIHVLLFSAYLDLAAEEQAQELGVQTISKVDRTGLFVALDAQRTAFAR